MPTCLVSLGGVNLNHRQHQHRRRTPVPHAAAQTSVPGTESLNSYFENECNVVTSLQVKDAENASQKAVACCAKEDIDSVDQVLFSMVKKTPLISFLFTMASPLRVLLLGDPTRTSSSSCVSIGRVGAC